MNIIKNIFFSIGIAYVLIVLQNYFQSKYIIDFLDKNIITIIIALLAINLTTLSIVLSKIRELIDQHNINISVFKNTQDEILLSIKEQIILIFISFITLTIITSEWLKLHTDYSDVFNTLLISCFVYTILILYDTAKSIFIIINFNRE